MDNFSIDIEENDGRVVVQDNEFSIVGDSIYASVEEENAPTWLVNLVNNVVSTKIAAGFNDYDILVEDVRNAVLSIDAAANTYVEQSSFTDLVNGIIGTHIETLNTTFSNNYATKIELNTVATSSDAAIAQSISDLSASVGDQINAAVTTINTAMATNQQAIATDITSLTTVLDGNSAEISQTLQSIDGIEASWSIDTDVNGQVAGIKLINSADTPSKFIINTDVFEVRNASTGDIVIGTENSNVVVDATDLNGRPATEVLNDLDNLVVDFNTQNNRNNSAISDPILTTTAISHTTRDDGSVDLTISWNWAGNNATIDGFAINMYASNVSGTYTWGSELGSETIFQVQADKRSNTFTGLPSNLNYSFQILAYRKVDPDVDNDGVITSAWIAPSVSQNPYQPETVMSITADIAGTVGGTSVQTLLDNLDDVNNLIIDFNTQNNRNSSTILDPTIQSDGTAIDHTINTDGSADISFEWGWAGDEGDIDGFIVLHFQSISNSTYTFGTTPSAETAFQVPANARSFILRGVAADRYHALGIIAYRKVDKDVSNIGVLLSSTVVPSLANEVMYIPSSSVAFSGNIVGTIDGYSASTVRSNAYSGATFTSSNAGNLAYIDTVTTTHIDNLAVNRLKIADESAGILKYTTGQSGIYGVGWLSWIQVMSLSITTPESANCFVSVSLQQSYNLAGTSDQRTGYRLKMNGTVLQSRSITVINDSPSMTSAQALPAGTNIFTVEWYGGSSDVTLFSRSLTGYVSLR